MRVSFFHRFHVQTTILTRDAHYSNKDWFSLSPNTLTRIGSVCRPSPDMILLWTRYDLIMDKLDFKSMMWPTRAMITDNYSPSIRLAYQLSSQPLLSYPSSACPTYFTCLLSWDPPYSISSVDNMTLGTSARFMITDKNFSCLDLCPPYVIQDMWLMFETVSLF